MSNLNPTKKRLKKGLNLGLDSAPFRGKLNNTMANQLEFDLKAKFNFRQDVLDIIIGGTSSIDASEGFRVHNLDEAQKFILSYGYDLDDPIEHAEVQGNFHEALNFIRKTFLQPENPEGLRLEVPRKIMEISDIRELFLMVSQNYPGQSSDTMGQNLQNWACSILKVMHTVSHLDKDIRTSYFSDIQKQIFDRFYKHIYRDPDGQLFLAPSPKHPLSVPLIAFETKPKKSRYSLLLKLLHKPENVADDIFDRVGIRFVTPTILDSLSVVKYLQEKMIIMPANIKPSRSRNTLVDIGVFRSNLQMLLEKVGLGQMDEAELRLELERITNDPSTNTGNPHTSEHYRAIQFTCRRLIKLRNPISDDLRELKTESKSKLVHEDILRIIDRINMKNVFRDIRFFYPFEIQVVDARAAKDNELGRSAHSEYKKAQVATALKRVMGNLADAVR